MTCGQSRLCWEGPAHIIIPTPTSDVTSLGSRAYSSSIPTHPFPLRQGGSGSPAPCPWPSPLTAIGGMSARWTGHRDNLGDELPSSTRMDGHPGSAGGLP